MNCLNRLPVVFALLLMMGMVVGCGDSAVITNAGGDNNLRDDEDRTRPSPSDEYMLVAASERNPIVGVGDNLTLRVILIHRGTGEQTSNQSVNFEIIDGETGDTTLSARNATTNADGEAHVILRAGSPATMTVRARHQSSNAVDFTVSVEPYATGAIRVTPVNTAPTIMRLQGIDVRLYRNDVFTCDDFLPLLNLQPDGQDIKQAATAGTPVTFEEVGTLTNFVLTAVARGEHGQIAAGGCIDRVRAEADRTIDIELLLQLIPLNPVGRYEVLSHWDFTDALADSGSAGAIIVRVLNVFDNPGRAIYDEVINLVGLAVGGIISGALDTFLSWTGLDNRFQTMINNFIENNAVLRRIRDAGRDLRDVVANLEVHSELTIGKLSSNYEFRGTDNWKGVTLYWRWNCDENAAPDCGAIRLVPDSNGEFNELGILSSEWSGRVVAYNQLQIDRHSVSLRYGRLIIYVLNDVIIPAMTDGNAHSMSEAFAYWIGCDRLANSIIPNGEVCAMGACIRASQIEGFCTTAVSTLFSFADLLVRGLEFDMGLHLGGSGRLVETDSDGLVDRIDRGVFEGMIQNSEGGSSSPFTATFEAERIDLATGGL